MLARGTVCTSAILGALALAVAGNAGDKTNHSKKRLTSRECARLVEQLANSGKPPFTEPYVTDLPTEVSESSLIEKQQKIAAAYDELSANIAVALPVLVEHVNDKQFSYVYENGVSGVYYPRVTLIARLDKLESERQCSSSS